MFSKPYFITKFRFYVIQVLQTLEFARELSSQFKTLAIEEEKTRKKQIKKDLQERNKVEIERIASTIEIQVRVLILQFDDKSY